MRKTIVKFVLLLTTAILLFSSARIWGVVPLEDEPLRVDKELINWR